MHIRGNRGPEERGSAPGELPRACNDASPVAADGLTRPSPC